MQDDGKAHQHSASSVSVFIPDRLITSSRNWLKLGEAMHKEVITVSAHESVVAAAKMMSDHKISCVVVVDDGKVVGILTERDYVKRVAGAQKDYQQIQVGEVMIAPVISAPPEMSIYEASQIMGARQIKRLPIVSGGRLLGIVTQTDLTRALSLFGMWRDVGEIMSKEVAQIHLGAYVSEAIELMAARNISCLAVMEGEKAVGIFTERDLLKRVISLEKNPAQIKISEAMSSPVIHVTPDCTVLHANKVMEKMNIRRLLVMENEKLCGVITQTDIFRSVKMKLQEEEDQNYKLLEQSESCIYATNLNGDITYVNPAFMRLLEISDAAQFLNQPFLPDRFWLHPEDREIFLKSLKESGGVQSKELTLKTANGKKIYVTLFSTITKDVQGEINGTQGMLQDMTAEKELVALREAQEALRESEHKYKLLSEELKDVVFRISPLGILEYCSPAIRDFGGYNEEEEIGSHISKYIAKPTDLTRAVMQLGKAVFSKMPVGIELLFKAKDREPFYVEITGKPLVENDQVKTVQCVMRDVTERKEAEETLKKAMEIKSGFISMVSHELRTPLTAIQEGIGIVLEGLAGNINPEQKDFLETAKRNVDRLNRLINDVLDFQKLESGKMAFDMAMNDMNEVIRETHKSMLALAGKKNLSFELRLDEHLPQVKFDRDRIHQVLANLVHNAIKFSSQGGITITTSRVEDFIQVAVEDTGHGIHADDIPKLFHHFEQLSHTTWRKTGGTGLGLAICKEIIESHHGQIRAKSELGKGTSFFFVLPIEPGA